MGSTLDTGPTTLVWLNNAAETLPWDGDQQGDSSIAAFAAYGVALDGDALRGVSIFGRYPIANLLRFYPMNQDDAPLTNGVSYPIPELGMLMPVYTSIPTTTYGADVSANQANAVVHNVTLPPMVGLLRLVYWAAPLDLIAKNGVAGVVLTWQPTEGTTSYTVERIAGDVWAAIGTTTGTTYTDSDAAAGVRHQYRVRASNGIILGAWSDSRSIVRTSATGGSAVPPPWAAHPLFVGYYTPAGRLVLDATSRMTSCTVETNDHGYYACAVEIPMRADQALAYAMLNGPLECRVSVHGRRLHVGRLENTGVLIDGGTSKLTATSYGYQAAFSDIRYTAFFSTSSLDAWEGIKSTEFLGFAGDRFDTDVTERGLVISFHNDQTPGAGGMIFRIPNDGRRKITDVATSDLLHYFPEGWTVGLYSGQQGSTDLHLEYAFTTVGYPRADDLTYQVTPCDYVAIAVAERGSDPVTTGDNNAPYFVRIGKIRVYSTDAPVDGTVDGSDIMGDLLHLQSSVNPTQLQNVTALFQNAGLDIQEANYQDSDGRSVLNDLVALGGSDPAAGAWGWAVWEKDRIMYAPLASIGREWCIDVESFEWERVLSELYNSIYTVKNGARGPSNTDIASLQRYGIFRDMPLSVDDTAVLSADRQVQLQLQDSADPLPRTSINIGTTVYDKYGTPHPAAFVRGLDRITVRNLASLVPVAAKFRSFLVTHTAFKPHDNTMDVTLQSPIPALQWMLQRAKVGV